MSYFLQPLVPYPCHDLITTQLPFPLQEPRCRFSLEVITTQVPFWCYIPPMPHLPPPCSHEATPLTLSRLLRCPQCVQRGREARSLSQILKYPMTIDPEATLNPLSLPRQPALRASSSPPSTGPRVRQDEEVCAVGGACGSLPMLARVRSRCNE